MWNTVEKLRSEEVKVRKIVQSKDGEKQKKAE